MKDAVGFIAGIDYVMRGFKLLFAPKIRLYVLMPLLLNIVLFIVIWGIGIHYYAHLINWVNTHLPSWLMWLDALFWLIYAIMMLLITAYAFSLVAAIVGAPFYCFLSEAVQKNLTNQPLPEGSWLDTLKTFPKALSREGQKIRYYIPRLILLVIIGFIPVINLISAFLWVIWGGWMQAVQYLDYPLDNNHIGFNEMRVRMSKHKGLCLGFGMTLMILFMIPIVNIFAIPAAVIGGVLLAHEHQLI